MTEASSADEEMDRLESGLKTLQQALQRVMRMHSHGAAGIRDGNDSSELSHGRLKLPHTARMGELSQRGRNQPICQTEANDNIKLKLHQLQRSPGRHSKGCFCCEMMKISRHMDREPYKVVSWQPCLGIYGEKNFGLRLVPP